MVPGLLLCSQEITPSRNYEQLLNEAVKVAGKRGARVVEAYPVDPDSPSYRFMGFVSKFERAGFVETGRAGKRRHIMHLMLE
jgi:hypothetical protein